MRLLYSQFRGFWLLSALLLIFSACTDVDVAEPSPALVPTAIATPEPTLERTSEPVVHPTVASAVEPSRIPVEKYADLEMVTLLPRDAIPAIDNPQFLEVAEADTYYDPDELIIGVEFEGDARAYSVPFLSNHEIVNDTVGGVKIAITW